MPNINAQCTRCQRIVRIPCSEESYVNAQFWNARTDPRPIQEVFPDMRPEHREMFITGLCPECWDKMFGYEEEEDE